MTDEELGRAWCKKNGKRPGRMPEGFLWKCDDGSWMFAKPETLLPAGAYPVRRSTPIGEPTYDTEAEAYAAVGAALRKVVSLADEVRELAGPS